MVLQYNYAANNFGLKNSNRYLIPKMKFMYYVEFNINEAAKAYLNSDNQARKLSFMVRSADRPSLSYDTVEMNQYNRPRVVHTKVKYNSLSLSFYDTVDGTALRLLQDYNLYYFGDFNKSQRSWNYDTIYGPDSTGAWGYRLKPSPANMYFFNSIDIYEFYGGTYTKYSIMNPKLESANLDSTDVTDVAGFHSINLSVKPEGVIYEVISQPVTDDIAVKFGIPINQSTNIFRTFGDENDLNLFGRTSGLFDFPLPGTPGFKGFANNVLSSVAIFQRTDTIPIGNTLSIAANISPVLSFGISNIVQANSFSSTAKASPLSAVSTIFNKAYDRILF